MAYNGSGQFLRIYSWVTDRINGVKIRADRMDAEFDGIAVALTNCLTRDGQSPPTQNLPMGGKRHTGAGAAVDATDYIIKQQFDDALSPGASNIGDYLTTERNPGSNWLRRDGTVYSQATYPALYTLLGDRYAKLAGFSASGLTFGVSTDINSMAYGAGLFVAVGVGGMIRTSPTGATWTARTSGVSEEFSRIAFLNSQFVATTFGGNILTSTDGITWTARTSGVTTDLNGIAYGQSKYVIVGASGVILVSPDNGVNWIPKSVSGFTETISGAAYGNGRFVLVGGAGGGAGGASVTSIDGNTFTMSRTGHGGGHGDVVFAKGIFVATGNEAAYVSSSGIGSWQAYGLPISGNRIAYGINNFLIVGTGTTSSIDGRNWDSHTALASSFNGIAASTSFALTGGGSGALGKSTYALDIVTQFQVPADQPDLGWIKAL